ncbi:MAG TPA: YidC/Oxa1 family membrane protein insertase [Candidatus Saccharimonadales bacterium]|nr:YidC/Oxa1 family membrane protein insertase [Candidatus Saccharimonadales bacterium]
MFVASLFQTVIVKPIFNLLVLIYAILPGHNFGLSIVIFTVVIRLLMWPLVKKQLHQAKAMREMQPEIKRVKAAAKGDRQKESTMLMELYKEKQISPFGSLGVLIVQLIILIGLYQGLHKVILDPHALIINSYEPLRHLSWMKILAGDIGRFDSSLLGLVDLKRAALHKGGTYWPAMVLVLGSATSQFFQGKQLMPVDKNARKLRHILKEATAGKKSDNSEINAAVGRSTSYLIPVMIFLFTVNIASALSLYWLVSGVTAYFQQARILSRDEKEMEVIADKPGRTVIEGEVIQKPKNSSDKSAKNSKKRKKRR